VIIRNVDGALHEGVSHDPEILKRVLLRRDEVPPVLQYAVTTIAPGQVARSHAHADMFEIFLCNAGKGIISIDGSPHDITDGTLVVVEPGERHELSNLGDHDLTLTIIAVQV
jgi:quercetin dioxygenase-like cupin family protein